MDSRDMLTGALIALSTTAGRATQYVSDETDSIVIGGLAACAGDNPNDAALSAFVERAHAENVRLAKESEGFANVDYDMDRLEKQDENIRSLKKLILQGLRDIAGPALRARNLGLSNDDTNAFFRAALFTIGGQDATMVNLIELATSVGEVNWYICEALNQQTDADNQAKELAVKLSAGLKDQTISHIFFVGGGNAAEAAYNYYDELAQNVPETCAFATYGSIGDRFVALDLQTQDNEMRLVNLGSRTDIYTAIQTSIAMASEFNKSVNDLPLNFLISQYCEEGFAALLTLLWIGITNVSLGPILPDYLPEKALTFFKQAYALRISGDATADAASFLK